LRQMVGVVRVELCRAKNDGEIVHERMVVPKSCRSILHSGLTITQREAHCAAWHEQKVR
jgi:hypothetical protein